MKGPITTHVLDTSLGRPARGVRAALEARLPSGGWKRLGAGTTDADGRIAGLLPASRRLAAGAYRLTFDTGAYFARRRQPSFYPKVEIVFDVRPGQTYHVPLLLSPFGYSTYRGS